MSGSAAGVDKPLQDDLITIFVKNEANIYKQAETTSYKSIFFLVHNCLNEALVDHIESTRGLMRKECKCRNLSGFSFLLYTTATIEAES